MRTLVVGGVVAALVLEEGDAPALDADRLRLPLGHLVDGGNPHELSIHAHGCAGSSSANTSMVVRPSAKRRAVVVAAPLALLVRTSVA